MSVKARTIVYSFVQTLRVDTDALVTLATPWTVTKSHVLVGTNYLTCKYLISFYYSMHASQLNIDSLWH